MQQLEELDLKIMTMAARIHELREVVGLTTAEMAQKCGVSEEEYIACESGTHDLASRSCIARPRRWAST